MRSTGYASLFRQDVIGWFLTAAIGAFRSSLFRYVVPSAVRCRTVFLLLCFLIVDINTSGGISIPLSLLMLFAVCHVQRQLLGLLKYQKMLV